MRDVSRVLSFLMFFLCLVFVLPAQTFSERQEIAIFRLSFYGQPSVPPPPGVRVEIRGRHGSLSVHLRGTGNPAYDDLFARAFGSVDEQIRSVFINLGRFDVIGMQQRLTQESVDDFIAALSDYRATEAEIPEAVLLGQQAFTERDFRQLAGGFIVVIPSVSWFDLRRDRNGRYTAEMQTSFTFVDVREGRTFGQFFIETSGASDRAEAAVRSTVDALPGELSFRVRSMPEFQLRTGILEVTGREVLVEFGRNMGLQRGDEYAIVAERVLATGHIAAKETGLIVIREVQEDFSYARVIYANPRARVGDQLQEVPRRGFETQIYYDVLTDGLRLSSLLGVKAVASRGFYDWRPFGAIEIPFRGAIVADEAPFFPLNMVIGGEWNAFVGRLRITPSASVGLGGAVPLGSESDRDTFYLTHFGGVARLTGSLLLGRDVLVSVQTGLGYWVSVFDERTTRDRPPLAGYGGLVIGGGVTLK